MEERDPTAPALMRAHMPEAPAWLMAQGRAQRFLKGAEIFCRQERLRYVFIVRSGTVIISSIGENGQENRVVMVTAGGVVGEMEAIVGAERLLYSARAFEDCELVRLPVDQFVQWVRTDAQACWELTRVLAAKLYAASAQTSQYAASDAMQRLISLLAHLGPGRVTYTRQDLAGACSVSLRTINRCVARLHQGGLIGLLRGKITLTPAQLARLSDSMQDET